MLVKAGPVQALYDKGFLRYIQTAGHEVVRMVYFAVRDQDWNTLSGTLTNETIVTTDQTFHIQYTCLVHEADIQIIWQVDIRGEADGTIAFTIRGRAKSTFLKNRAGFCVLHPIEGIIGQPCRIEHSDGNFTNGTFPTFISPHQPFYNIQGMEWPVAGQGLARLEFTGDIFETEDQRNWSDASFKTYCTPLSLPFPAVVNSGEEIYQQVVFRLLKTVSATTIGKTNPALVITWQPNPLPFPEIGIGINPDGPEPNTQEYTFLQSVNFKHLRADVFFNEPAWLQQWQKATRQSTTLNLPLELALFFGENPEAELNDFLTQVQPDFPALKRIVVFDTKSRLTTNYLLQALAEKVRIALPGVLIGSGTDLNFAEFNRNPFDYSLTDFVCYSINPQVHAFDDLSIIENAAAQADTVRSAHHLTTNRPVYVSPVTIKPRFNPVATSGQAVTTLPADPRQPTNFIAGWTLASLKYLAEAGTRGITYYETTGVRGICQGGQPFAAGQLLAFISKFEPHQIIPTHSPEPLKITTLLLQNKTNTCLLITNHTPDLQTVLLPAGFKVLSHTFIGTAINNHQINILTNQLTLIAHQTIALTGELTNKR